MAFQPPVVIFQPPDISAARTGEGTGRQGGDNGLEQTGGGEGRPASRRRNSQRGATGGGADGAGGPGDGQSGGRQARDGDREGQGDVEDHSGDSRTAVDQDSEAEQGTGAGKRRRRGGRGHGKARTDGESAEAGAGPGQDTEGADSGSAAAAGGEAADADDDEGDSSRAGRRRRRRRRSGTGADADALAPDDPPDTVVHVRPPRQSDSSDDVRSIKGSTRLEAKRQRRREGRDSGRRRPPVITESEFLARREAVERVMVVRQTGERTQIAVLEDGVLVEHYVDKASHQSYVGNVYLGKVQNVLPSMEAAFVDIGKGRNAVLYAGEVNFDASGLEGESKRIESALKSGQSILVQVTKDPIGHKGARLTSQVSLPGRYLVYVPGSSMTGISRKLPDTERTRLKQILKKVMPENAGVIVRTAAEGASEEELSQDVARLAAQWEAIERKAKTASAPELLYSEPDLTIRVVRDIFNEDFGRLVIASDSDWDMVDEYVRYVAPTLAQRLERWTSDKDVFAAYRIDEQLAKALERKVWLPSGGSLVIDATEAMTVIDVNTGKFTGQGGNLEQTVTRNNLEAAEEIVRQLRLRDVGGIIVIDFIDMVLESNRELVLRRLLECLARDRTKHQVAEVTSLGLVQMTRKRVGSGLLEAFSVPCEHCNGRGVLLSLEPVDHTLPRGRSGDGDRGERNGKGERKGNGGGNSGDDAGGGQRSRSGRSRRGRSSGQTATAGPEATADPAGVPAGSATQADSSPPADWATPPPASEPGDPLVGPPQAESSAQADTRAQGDSSADADSGAQAGQISPAENDAVPVTAETRPSSGSRRRRRASSAGASAGADGPASQDTGSAGSGSPASGSAALGTSASDSPATGSEAPGAPGGTETADGGGEGSDPSAPRVPPPPPPQEAASTAL